MADPFTRRGGPRLTADEAGRQGRISQMAILTLGNMAILTLGNKAAIAFLNTHDAALDGRPLDLAIRSAEGLAAAEQALLRRNAKN